MMLSCLFISLKKYQKTKADEFVSSLLSLQYRLDFFYADEAGKAFPFQDLPAQKYTLVACFDVMPSLHQLKQHLSFQNIVFFPMYESYRLSGGIRSHLWDEYGAATIICFVKQMASEICSAGFNAKYIKYFPPMPSAVDFGNEEGLFFQPKGKRCGVAEVLTLLQNYPIKKINLHRFFYEEEQFPLPAETWLNKITYTDRCARDDLTAQMMQSAFYAASDEVNGVCGDILEAMAAGRAVIAPDNPITKEYIKPFKTGFLYAPDDVRPLPVQNIRQIQENTLLFMRKGFKRWEKEKGRIFSWCTQSGTFNKKALRAARQKAGSLTVCRPVKWGVYKKIKLNKETVFSYVFAKKIMLVKVKKAGSFVTKVYLFGKVPFLKIVRKERFS